MKTTNSFLLTGAALLLALTWPASASAQPASAPITGEFIGQTYSGLDWGYTRHTESAPSVLHRYGFVTSRPLLEAENVDAAFRYNYTRGTTLGPNGRQHDFDLAFTGYISRGSVKPFLEGRTGWAWAKAGAVSRNSFAYLVGGGLELLLAPQFSLTPFVNFRETPHFHERGWNGGVKAGFRLNRGWSSSVTVEFDDEHNTQFSFGVQLRN